MTLIRIIHSSHFVSDPLGCFVIIREGVTYDEKLMFQRKVVTGGTPFHRIYQLSRLKIELSYDFYLAFYSCFRWLYR